MTVPPSQSGSKGCLRALLDITPLGPRPENRTGLARVALSLAEAIARREDVAIRTSAWGSLLATDEFEAVRAQFPELNGVAVRQTLVEREYAAWCRSAASKMPQLRTRIGQALNLIRNPLRGVDLGQYDVFHSTYARFPRVVRRQPQPKVITVHDLTPLRLPARFFPPEQSGITWRIIDSIEKDDWVACVSEFTRQDFLAHTGHPPERAVTIHNGVDHSRFAPVDSQDLRRAAREKAGIGTKPFLLTLSSLAPHKNLRLLIELWPEVRRAAGDAVLVIAGGKTRDPAELLRALGVAAIGEGILLTGYLTDEEVCALASECQAFLFPSLYEGFGLPVLEAMACGAPVIASDRSSIPEVVADVGELIDPDDRAAWVAAMIRASSEPQRLHADPKAIARAGQFSWDAAAAAYAGLYARACS